ncbi:MlaC/ttg2D family ABC transporter substrate-binding protein [Thiopseudomonas acetoxidans]|uniref:ABC transporter substrate-binding protein n=1 Tax=Thiopseudomonas acetoxidans TaxID=3041622 RepID=A0ABT7SKY6_9GAMM|nr:ABC transporter substrate-binding protein [Thiopseudomonas sp. CY1220]MDM7856854.1 ABC transporter substrate-binding protein [Thiopseudomonas sp. CY1220]
MIQKLFSRLSFVAVLLLFTGIAQAEQTAHQVVEQTVDELFSDLNENREQYRADPETFYAMMNRVIGEVVDVEGVARSVMTVRYSRRATQAQIVRFQENFKRSLMQFYGNALLEYNNSGVRVLPANAPESEQRTEVRMEVKDSQGVVYPVSYTMVKVNGRWKLRNVVIEGINIGKLFRDQFAEAMQRNRNNLDLVIDTWVDTVARTRQAEAAK